MRWFGWLRATDYSWPKPPRPIPEGSTLCSQATMWNTDLVRLCVFGGGCGGRCVRYRAVPLWHPTLIARMKAQR